MDILDVAGVGFGPSNLALAVAIDEHNKKSQNPLSMAFFECSSEFKWHEDMLIPDSTVQISFMKDLVTLRNPTSEYSFLNYLKSKDRLLKFSNLKVFYPTRMEFSDYFKWAENKLPEVIHYNKKVVEIKPSSNQKIDYWEIIYEDLNSGNKQTSRCKNLVIAIGGTPRIPEEAPLVDNKVWHSSTFLSNIKKFNTEKPYDFCVCGGGQSAAEIVDYLHSHFPKANVHSVFSSFGYKPADDSSFVNEIFDPEMVDMFYHSDKQKRQSLLEEYSNTNYKVVDIDLIDKLYHTHYQELINGKERLFFHKMHTLKSAHVENNKVITSIKDVHSNNFSGLSVDALILATGYTRTLPEALLHSVQDQLVYREGELTFDRYFQVETRSQTEAAIVLQGFSENIHGISNTLLSTLSTRSQEILDNVLLKNQSTPLDGHYNLLKKEESNEVAEAS